MKAPQALHEMLDALLERMASEGVGAMVMNAQVRGDPGGFIQLQIVGMDQQKDLPIPPPWVAGFPADPEGPITWRTES